MATETRCVVAPLVYKAVLGLLCLAIRLQRLRSRGCDAVGRSGSPSVKAPSLADNRHLQPFIRRRIGHGTAPILDTSAPPHDPCL